MAVKGYGLTPGAMKKTADAVRWVGAQPRHKTGRPGGDPTAGQVLDAVITAVTAINGGIRWRYTIKIGYYDMTSSASDGGVWTLPDSDTFDAFNDAESMNTFGSGTGTIGTGNTDVAQTDGTIGSSSCTLKALPVGGKVSVRLRGIDDDGASYFTIINAMNSAQ